MMMSGTKISGAQLTLPMSGDVRLYRGTQRTTTGGTVYQATVDAADARVEPPRFTLSGTVPALEATVTDSQNLTLKNLDTSGTATFTVHTADDADSTEVTLAAGEPRTTPAIFQ